MADIFDEAKRRKIMTAVKQKNSKMELEVFKYLNRQRIYYQKHYKRAPGTPDIALPRKKRAVFIDGDFWHGRSLSELRRQKDPDDFWVVKIQKNVERDDRQLELLKQQGWAVLRVWESDLERKATRVTVLERIASFLTRV